MPKLAWCKSSFSGGEQGACVELATGRHSLVHLRESDRPREVVTTTRTTLAAPIEGVRAGEFDGLVG